MIFFLVHVQLRFNICSQIYSLQCHFDKIETSWEILNYFCLDLDKIKLISNCFHGILSEYTLEIVGGVLGSIVLIGMIAALVVYR